MQNNRNKRIKILIGKAQKMQVRDLDPEQFLNLWFLLEELKKDPIDIDNLGKFSCPSKWFWDSNDLCSNKQCNTDVCGACWRIALDRPIKWNELTKKYRR